MLDDMIVLFTDFGSDGPYVGQMKAVLHLEAPGVPVVDLFNDAPYCNPRASAYLLAAYGRDFPAGSVFLAVVDPGVGSARGAVMLHADDRWYVGPDNGLLEVVAAQAEHSEWWNIDWQPPQLSATFHGRDLFAPVAARLARGDPPAGHRRDAPASPLPADLYEIIYIDHFGNAITGIRAATLDPRAVLRFDKTRLKAATTFADVAVGSSLWLANSSGLIEIAVNCGRADKVLGLAVGDHVRIET
jgi:S-adenosylmethionine hydrolase